MRFAVRGFLKVPGPVSSRSSINNSTHGNPPREIILVRFEKTEIFYYVPTCAYFLKTKSNNTSVKNGDILLNVGLRYDMHSVQRAR